MLFIYWATSFLLLLVGAVLYAGGLRSRLSAGQAKGFLLGILLLSALLPSLLPNLPHYEEALESAKTFDYYTYNEWNVVDIRDPELLNCYDKAKHSRDFCHCEIVQKSKILVYEPNPYYNFLLACRQPVSYIFWIVATLFLLNCLCKWAYLLYLVYSSPRQRQELDGTPFYILKTRYPFPISSFTLWQHYVIYSPVLEQFTEEEKNAILLHELAHLRGRDTWQQLLLQLFRTIWWMNPVLYWLQKELNRLNEFVADEFVLQRWQHSNKYARLLVSIKEQQNHLQQPSYTLSFAQSLLHSRILRIIQYSKPSVYRTWTSYWYGAIVLLVLSSAGWWAKPKLASETIALEQYQILKAENNSTGLRFFCRDCIQERFKTQKN